MQPESKLLWDLLLLRYVIYGKFPQMFHIFQKIELCRLFRIAEARNYPWLLSANMHALKINDVG